MKDDEGVRYAIRHSDGSFSNGPRCDRVSLDKAKLWKNLGHVKTHLQMAYEGYDPGATIVRVRVVYEQTDVAPVDEYMEKWKTAKAAQQRLQRLRDAEREVEVATKRLHEAKRNYGRMQ